MSAGCSSHDSNVLQKRFPWNMKHLCRNLGRIHHFPARVGIDSRLVVQAERRDDDHERSGIVLASRLDAQPGARLDLGLRLAVRPRQLLG